MTFVIAALAGHAELHQDLAVRRQFGDLKPLAAILGYSAVGDPDIAVTIDMQAVRKHKQPGADAFDRLAGLQIELNDGRMIGAVATIGAATVDGPDLAMWAALNAGGRAPRARGRRGPLMFGRTVRTGDGIL